MAITKQGGFITGALGKPIAAGALNIGKNVAVGVGLQAVVGAGMALAKIRNEIKNNAQRKMLIQQLRNEPALSKIDEEQFMEWYATIVHFAPKMSLDKSTVREIMTNFARFGRVDINTLKTLAETEKAMVQSKPSGGWGDIFSGIASGIGTIQRDAFNSNVDRINYNLVEKNKLRDQGFLK